MAIPFPNRPYTPRIFAKTAPNAAAVPFAMAVPTAGNAADHKCTVIHNLIGILPIRIMD